MISNFTAADLYGGSPLTQPVSTPGPSTNPANGAPENKIRTLARPSGFNNPTLLLVILLGVAFALIHFSVSGSIKVSA